MNSNVESTNLLRLLMKRVLECHGAAASSDLPDNTGQQDPLSSRPVATSTSGNAPSTGALDRSAARQETWLTFLQKYVLASAELESFISDQELQIETLKHSMVDQKTKIAVLECQLEEREKEVADRERNIVKRESGVVERERALAEREQEVAGREQVVAKREQVVTKREQVVAEREQAALVTQGKLALEQDQFHKNKENASVQPPPTPPIQWSPIFKGQCITLDAAGLKACASTVSMHRYPVVTGTQPLSPNRMYFELSVIKQINNKFTAIGSTTESPKLNLDQALGMWKTCEWAYHSDHGEIFLGKSLRECTYEAYTEGDVVGCGIDNRKHLFFTKNGKKFGQALLSHTSGAPLWPVANVCHGGEIIANFGPKFVYKF